MKFKTLGLLYLKLVGEILKCRDEEFCERIKPRLEEVFIEIKKMGVQLAKLGNGGKLPNADSVGWKEEFWRKRFNKQVARRESIKRLLKQKQDKELNDNLDLDTRLKRLEEKLKCQK